MACPATLTATFWLAFNSMSLGWAPDARPYWRAPLLGYSVIDDRGVEVGFTDELSIELPCAPAPRRFSVKGYSETGADTPWYGFSDPVKCLPGVDPDFRPDADGDCYVGGADFGAFVHAFRAGADARFDANGDGRIGGPDFGSFAAAFGGQIHP